MKRILTCLIATLFTSMLLNVGLFVLHAVASGGPYDWPMSGYNPLCMSFSPSAAPNTNATAWVSSLPGGTVWAYPVVAEGKVFIGAGGVFNAFSESTGSLVWSFSAPGQPGYPCETVVGNGGVFFGTKEPGPAGCIYALNTTTGEELWEFATEGYLQANPTIVEDRLYFGGYLGSLQGKIYCINATTGESLWNYTTQDRPVTIAVAYENVYVSCGHWETSTMAAIYCLNMYDGSLIWSFDTSRDISGSLSIANGKVYTVASYETANCIVYAFNATNGAVVWSTTRYSNAAAGRTAVAYGKLFISLGSSARGVYALDEADGDEIWAFPGQSIGGGPVVADGKVFFARGDSQAKVFYAVNEATGAVVWSYELPGGVHSSTSAIANGRLFVADHYDSKLYAFGAPTAPPLSVSISPLSASILVGQSVIFASTVSGGYTPYTYQWYLNGAPVSGAASASWTFTPTTSGVYYVYLKVTDAKANTSQSDTARIAVASVPVGGYSIPIQVHTKTEPIIPYIASVIALTAILNLRRKIKRKR
jgi:outer membrane protein assembly factor BamB